VLDHILEFCEKMGLAVEGNETKLFDFLAALEATRKKATVTVDEEVEVGEVRERTMRHGENIKILSWNVRGLNCPINRGHVR